MSSENVTDRERVSTAGLMLIGLLSEWEKRDKQTFGEAEADLLLILRKVVSLYDYSQAIEGARVRLEHIRQACYYYDQSWGERLLDRLRQLEAKGQELEAKIENMRVLLNILPEEVKPK